MSTYWEISPSTGRGCNISLSTGCAIPSNTIVTFPPLKPCGTVTVIEVVVISLTVTGTAVSYTHLIAIICKSESNRMIWSAPLAEGICSNNLMIFPERVIVNLIPLQASSKMCIRDSVYSFPVSIDRQKGGRLSLLKSALLFLRTTARGPVSYTHLDVYKRQPVTRQMSSGRITVNREYGQCTFRIPGGNGY